MQDAAADDSQPTMSTEEQQEIWDRAREHVEHFSVGLMYVGKPGTVDVAELGGSGTLIQAGGRYGILTAAHVVQKFEENKEERIGLSFFQSRPGRATFRVGVTHVFGKKPFRPLEPDLAIFVLNTKAAADISSEHAFYRIDDNDRRRAVMLQDPYPPDADGWMLSGAVDRWSQGAQKVAESGSHAIKSVGGLLLGPSKFLGEHRIAQYDYLEFEIDANEDPEHTPETFRGMSGGGVWRVRAYRDGRTDIHLVGVLYFESERIDGRQTLTSHGRRSIYDVASEALAGS